MPPQTARWIGWPACFALVFTSAFFLSGTQPPPLELDPSWHAALEYAAAHHLQFGTQIVFTFGPLGFLSTRTSLGHLLGARIAFAFFWSALVALTATALAKRLAGWVRYAFLAWLVVFTLSSGLDQTAFFVMAYGTLLLLVDNPKQRWQVPLVVFAFIVLSLIKASFLTAALGSLAVVFVCWIRQRKTLKAIMLALAVPAGFIACWMALEQSPSHLAPWFRDALELASGYSGAMNLVPKTSVLCAALAALALFVGALIATIVRTRGGLLTWGVLITLAQYVFLAWKEGFTRSGDWHTFVFLWFLPLGLAFCFLGELSNAHKASHRWGLQVTFAASMALCLAAANFQIPGFAWQQVSDWPRRVTQNAEMIFATLRGRSDELYADCRDAKSDRMLLLDRAKDVIGNDSVDVMNYLLLAAVVNEMNYQPRPVIQGFVAYTPALQSLNEEYFRSAGRPHYVLLCQQATDGRFPTLEDSAALNYVLNNYVPVARGGHFLVLQQRTTEDLAFQLVKEESLHFGEKLDLRPWAQGPLFMSVVIAPSLLGRAATFLYQQHPLYMRLASGQAEERYRIVPSMAELPFLVNPLLDSNYDVLNLYASHPGKESESLTFERPRHGSFEFQDHLTVRLYAASAFLRAARGISVPRMLADVQGRVFWPEPKSVESAARARVMIFHGTPALMVRAPSTIMVEIPENASSFSGYFGIPEEADTGDGTTQGVEISIAVQDRSGHSRLGIDRFLQPSSRAEDRGRFSFRIPIDSAHDRTITLTTGPGRAEGGWSVWSQCRFEE
ncbi:MAG: hypothetical protein ABSF45_06030 [Terriglobia bacterium]|jgi:hypothetical protein